MKRRGFTLIELMVVIAIIIILAAIAIPNYLRMTERAKKSRLQSDFATLATVLETFKTDWGKYPVAAAFESINSAASVVRRELGGAAGGVGVINIAGKYNAVGEQGPVEYIKDGTLTSMLNPFDSTWLIMYGSADGTHWMLYAETKAAEWMTRSDSASTINLVAVVPAVVP